MVVVREVMTVVTVPSGQPLGSKSACSARATGARSAIIKEAVSMVARLRSYHEADSWGITSESRIQVNQTNVEGKPCEVEGMRILLEAKEVGLMEDN